MKQLSNIGLSVSKEAEVIVTETQQLAFYRAISRLTSILQKVRRKEAGKKSIFQSINGRKKGGKKDSWRKKARSK